MDGWGNNVEVGELRINCLVMSELMIMASHQTFSGQFWYMLTHACMSARAGTHYCVNKENIDPVLIMKLRDIQYTLIKQSAQN